MTLLQEEWTRTYREIRGEIRKSIYMLIVIAVMVLLLNIRLWFF